MPAPKRYQAQEEVLALAFEGRWSHAEMAQHVTVSARTVKRWLASPAFVQRLAMMRANLAESLSSVAYVDKASRIVGLSQMAESARREYEERPWLKEVRAFGETETTNEHFNRDAHAAFREALNDIAKELGERGSNVKISGGIEHSLVPHGEARALADEILAAVGDMPEARAALSARLLASGE